MMKWMSRPFERGNKSIIPSSIITIAIVVMLIISGPSQAVQVILNGSDLVDRNVGETGVFFINVTIGANERIPIANITVGGLPDIPGSPGGILIFNVSDFNSIGDFRVKGNYNITLFEKIGFVSDFGYGYGYEQNSNSQPYSGSGTAHQFYGYGYGYGNSANDFTLLKYKVTMDTTGSVPGNYIAVARLNAGKDVDGQNVVFQGSFRFELEKEKEEKHGAPSIKRFSPSSPVKDSAPATETFRIQVNQTVNITWFFNGANKKHETFVRESTFTNTTSVIRVHNITAIAENANGIAMQRWDWNVTAPSDRVIRANVIIKPETLNLASRGKFTAFISLPDGFNVNDIDIDTVECKGVVCDGARPVKSKITQKDGGTLILKFERSGLKVHTGDSIEFKITGNLEDAAGGARFEGSDRIRVINKAKNDDFDSDEDSEHDDDDEEDDEHDDDECDDCGDQKSENHGRGNTIINNNFNINNNYGTININIDNQGNQISTGSQFSSRSDNDDDSDAKKGKKLKGNNKGKKKGKK